MTHDEIRTRIEKELADFKDENGQYIIPFSLPYDYFGEGISVEAVQRILASDNPENRYNEFLGDIVQEYFFELSGADEVNMVEDHLSKSLVNIIDNNEFDLFQFITEYVLFVPDDTDFKGRKIDVDIIVDAGDMNYDFTQNTFANRYYYDIDEIQKAEHLPEHSSLVWLCEQQGITKEELIKVLHGESLLPKEAADLRKEKNELFSQLEEFGCSKFGSSYHLGIFNKFLKEISYVESLKIKIDRVNDLINRNSVSYEEFKERNPNNERARNLSEEDFNNLKENTLRQNYEALNKYMTEKEKIETTIMSDQEMKKVNDIYSAYSIVSKKYSDFLKQNPIAAGKQSFTESIVFESMETCSGMNALTFCVKMTLGDAIRLNQIKQTEKVLNDSYNPKERRGESFVTVSKDCLVGLYDPWHGSGSHFEIKLIKDVDLPVKYIDSANIDDYRGYSVENIYGKMEYKESLLSINEVPVKTLETMLEGIQNRPDVNISENNKSLLDKNYEEGRS